MSILYISLTILLWCSYWRALKSARDVRTPFTPIMGWLVGLGFFVLAPLTILVLHGGYQFPDFYQVNAQYDSVDLARPEYIIPVLVIWLSLFFAFEIVVLLRSRSKDGRTPNRPRLDDHGLKNIILITLGLSALDWTFTVWQAGGLQSFLITHWYLREEQAVARLGDIFVLYTHLSLANQIVFTAASALWVARQLQAQRIAWGFSSLLIVGFGLQMAISGNRIFVALCGLSFLTACWFYRRRKVLVILFALSPPVFLLFSAWAYFRHNLSEIPGDIPTYLEADLGNRAMTTLMDTTEGSDVMLLIHMVNDFGGKFDFLYGLSYLRTITFIVPRKLYPNKPDNYTVQIAKLYEPGEVTSLNTTQLGELYANFGGFVVLLLPLLTALIVFLSKILLDQGERRILLLAVLFVLCVWLARSSFEDNFITFLFAVGIIRVLRLQSRLDLQIPRRGVNRLAEF